MTTEEKRKKIEQYINENPSHGYYICRDNEHVGDAFGPQNQFRYKTFDEFYDNILPKEYK